MDALKKWIKIQFHPKMDILLKTLLQIVPAWLVRHSSTVRPPLLYLSLFYRCTTPRPLSCSLLSSSSSSSSSLPPDIYDFTVDSVETTLRRSTSATDCLRSAQCRWLTGSDCHAVVLRRFIAETEPSKRVLLFSQQRCDLSLLQSFLWNMWRIFWCPRLWSETGFILNWNGHVLQHQTKTCLWTRFEGPGV